MRTFYRIALSLIVVLSAYPVLADDVVVNEVKTEVTVTQEMIPLEEAAITDAPSMEEMMAKWQAFSTPGSAHKVLDQIIGNWDYTLTSWMDPTKEPEVSKGTSSAQWILGNRYVQQKVQGTAMGQPFEGMGLTGYDNLKEQYQSIWIDSMGTGFMASVGEYDEATKTLTENGAYTDPVLGERLYRAVTTFQDNDHHSYEMFIVTDDGQDFRSMKIDYTRKP